MAGLPSAAEGLPTASLKAQAVPIAGVHHTGNLYGADAALDLEFHIAGTEDSGFPPAWTECDATAVHADSPRRLSDVRNHCSRTRRPRTFRVSARLHSRSSGASGRASGGRQRNRARASRGASVLRPRGRHQPRDDSGGAHTVLVRGPGPRHERDPQRRPNPLKRNTILRTGPSSPEGIDRRDDDPHRQCPPDTRQDQLLHHHATPRPLPQKAA